MSQLISRPRQFLDRVSSLFPASSLFRYAIIGATAFVVDIGLLNIGLKFGLHLLAANGFAVAIAIVYSFILHRTITFAHRAKGDGYLMPRRNQFTAFVIVSLIALALNELLLIFFVHKAELPVNGAKIITSAILFVWNYIVNRSYTFRANR